MSNEGDRVNVSRMEIFAQNVTVHKNKRTCVKLAEMLVAALSIDEKGARHRSAPAADELA